MRTGIRHGFDLLMHFLSINSNYRLVVFLCYIGRVTRTFILNAGENTLLFHFVVYDRNLNTLSRKRTAAQCPSLGVHKHHQMFRRSRAVKSDGPSTRP